MNKKCITKCERIDSTLNGGIRVGEVTELYGESGVGKTQICLQLLLTCLLDPSDGGLYGSSIYIQACAVFPANRLQQLSTHLCANRVVDMAPLNLVHVKKIDDPGQLSLVLNQVEQMVLLSHEGCRHTRVVVLDSIACLLRHDHDYTATGFMERKRSLKAAANKMKQIARSYSIAFIVVNEVTDVVDRSFASTTTMKTYTSGREVKASLGNVWDSLMANKMFISLQYQPNNQSWYRECMVVRSTDTRLEGRRRAFRIMDKGLEAD